jgi:hypothetical protein
MAITLYLRHESLAIQWRLSKQMGLTNSCGRDIPAILPCATTETVPRYAKPFLFMLLLDLFQQSSEMKRGEEG